MQQLCRDHSSPSRSPCFLHHLCVLAGDTHRDLHYPVSPLTSLTPPRWCCSFAQLKLIIAVAVFSSLLARELGAAY